MINARAHDVFQIAAYSIANVAELAVCWFDPPFSELTGLTAAASGLQRFANN